MFILKKTFNKVIDILATNQFKHELEIEDIFEKIAMMKEDIDYLYETKQDNKAKKTR